VVEILDIVDVPRTPARLTPYLLSPKTSSIRVHRRMDDELHDAQRHLDGRLPCSVQRPPNAASPTGRSGTPGRSRRLSVKALIAAPDELDPRNDHLLLDLLDRTAAPRL
jgi:hypothetical protein